VLLTSGEHVFFSILWFKLSSFVVLVLCGLVVWQTDGKEANIFTGEFDKTTNLRKAEMTKSSINVHYNIKNRLWFSFHYSYKISIRQNKYIPKY
jgi:hypothetical protein